MEPIIRQSGVVSWGRPSPAAQKDATEQKGQESGLAFWEQRVKQSGTARKRGQKAQALKSQRCPKDRLSGSAEEKGSPTVKSYQPAGHGGRRAIRVKMQYRHSSSCAWFNTQNESSVSDTKVGLWSYFHSSGGCASSYFSLTLETPMSKWSQWTSSDRRWLRRNP